MTAGRALVASLIVVLLAAWWVRAANNVRVAEDPGTGEQTTWFSTDPDSFYHMRRLARAMDSGGDVDGRDPLLAYPEYEAEGGAPIPWPPGYTHVLRFLVAPFAPAEPAARESFIERQTASWPMRFGVASAVVTALAAAALCSSSATPLAVAVAALVAGLAYAFSLASVRYSLLGTGDHHAFLSLLHVSWLALAACAFSGGDRGRRSVPWLGAASGLLAGLALASWVAALVYVVLMQIAIAVAVARNLREPRGGIVVFGIVFHVAALAVVAPAAASSPWSSWEVVNLSWFHVLVLALGGALLLPLLWFRPDSPGLRRYPTAVAVTLFILCGVAALTPLGSGVREGIRWAGGAGDFMGYVQESQPLLGGRDGGASLMSRWLGLGVWLLPLVWLFALRSRQSALLPWLVAVPALLVLALLQRRFGDGLAAPMAVLLGWGAAQLVAASGARSRSVAVLALAVLVPVLSHHARAAQTWRRTVQLPAFPEDAFFRKERANRNLVRWLRDRTPEGAVLAQWDLGHLIEWVAKRPTVATNFGSYLGEASYRDPWRFLCTADDEVAESILERRRASHVVLTGDWDRNLSTMLRLERPRDHAQSPDRPPPGSVLARLLAGEGLGFLRLVYLGPAGGQVWEHVAGARVEARLEPGEVLEGSVSLRFPGFASPVSWHGSAVAGSDGVARLRVPHAGSEVLRWRAGERSGLLTIPDEALRRGLSVSVE